jgi:DNA-binding transcriptional LysR family regulator
MFPMRQQSDLQGLAVFSKVVETKSFSAAARSFDTTTSAVSKSIARLEDRLGVRLLTRTTRRVALTEVGTTLYANAVRILADVAEAENAVARIGAGVRGTLRVSVPVMFGERHVAPLIPALLAKHDELRVELSLSDRYVNLTEEGLDAAVRIGKLADSSLVAVRIGEVDSAVCASPSYLEAHGIPQTPHDLAMHECLRYTLVPMAREWRFRGPDGRELSVPVSGRLQMNHGAAMARSIIAGAGVARLPLFLVDDAIARGELVELLVEWKTKPSPIHVVHSSATQTVPKVRAFIEMMRGACKSEDVPRVVRKRTARR